ncbi:hypothetical protein EIP86_003685 [Pleurotus ostreatoroseus]|nr:hypothetical protein EIP86_003685 [Pleurotus ostreatoroseus]
MSSHSWGQSAGAISIGLHLVANGGNNEGLFRGAFMESGSPDLLPDLLAGQSDYDALVQATGCQTSRDTLECLRHAPFDVLKTAVDQTPSFLTARSLNFVWTPGIDGRLFKDSPFQSVVDGHIANVPFATGDCDDEGTAFTMALLNITTDEEVREFMSSDYLPKSSLADIDRLLVLYPQDPALGSPFDTGDLNELTPQFKRLAALQGDLVFQAPRRFLLEHRSDKQKAFAFLSKRFKDTPNLGSSHGTDVQLAYGQTDFTDYIVNFVHNLDPNGPTVPEWPQYSTKAPQLMTLLDGPVPINITLDTFREEPMAFMQQLALVNPVV